MVVVLEGGGVDDYYHAGFLSPLCMKGYILKIVRVEGLLIVTFLRSALTRSDEY